MALAETLTDAFTGTTIDTGKWTIASNLSVTDPAVTVTQNDQLQIMPLTGGTGAERFNGVQSLVTYDLTGSRVIVEVPQAASAVNQSETRLTALLSANNYFRVVKTGSNILFQARIGGVTTGSAAIPYNATTHRWWRIGHVTGTNTVELAHSPDGLDPWTIQHSVATPGMAITALSLGLNAGTYGATGDPAPVLVIFDKFNLPPVVTPVYTQTAYRFRVATGSLYAPP
jgi:hypothetical protein